MTMIETMRHFGIVVDDLDASLLFYKKYFGFEIEIDAHEKGSFIEKILAKDGIELRTVKLLSKASDVKVELIDFVKISGCIKPSKMLSEYFLIEDF